MAHYILLLLFIGAFIGWALLAYLTVHVIRTRRIEISMIEDISEELKKVKQEIIKLK